MATRQRVARTGPGLDRVDELVMQQFPGHVDKVSDYRLPELFTGFPQTAYRVPVRYPTACHPQAWGAGAVPFFLAVCLGIEPNAWDRQLRLVRPRLPSWLKRVELHGLRIGDSTVNLRFEQMGASSALC